MENYKDLLNKYLQNRCTYEELVCLLNWLKDPNNENIFEQYINNDLAVFDNNENKETEIDKVNFEVLKRRIHDSQLKIHRQHKIRKIVIRIAASFLLPIAVGCLTFVLLQKGTKNETIAYNEINAPLGSKTNIELSDGTKVWLNSGSKIRIPQKFVGNIREVQLTGEAYFDVKKDPSKPFIVKTSKLNIKALGTSFNVKAYPEEGTIETTLINGLVTISKNNNDANNVEAVLKPKQRATFVKESGKLVLADSEKKLVKAEVKIKVDQKREEKMICTKNVDTEQFVAWKDDKLVFKNEDFESLCIKLKRWYGVEFIIKSEELKKYHYTGVLQKETINDVIEILRLTMPFKYEINHSIIDLWSENAKIPN